MRRFCDGGVPAGLPLREIACMSREAESDWKPDVSMMPPGVEVHEHVGNLSEVLLQLEDELPEPKAQGLNSGCQCHAAQELEDAREQIVELERWIEQDAEHVRVFFCSSLTCQGWCSQYIAFARLCGPVQPGHRLLPLPQVA